MEWDRVPAWPSDPAAPARRVGRDPARGAILRRRDASRYALSVQLGGDVRRQAVWQACADRAAYRLGALPKPRPKSADEAGGPARVAPDAGKRRPGRLHQRPYPAAFLRCSVPEPASADLQRYPRRPVGIDSLASEHGLAIHRDLCGPLRREERALDPASPCGRNAPCPMADLRLG